MNQKPLWWSLLLLQIVLYGFFTPLQRWRYSAEMFMLALSLSCGISVVLVYLYVCRAKKIETKKQKAFLMFISSALIAVLLTLLLGELMFVVDFICLISFVIILIFTGKKSVFA